MTKQEHDEHSALVSKAVRFGIILGLLGIVFVCAVSTFVFHRASVHEQRDWLRKHTVKHGQYTPCTNAGADWAMGVDCAEYVKLRGGK